MKCASLVGPDGSWSPASHTRLTRAFARPFNASDKTCMVIIGHTKEAMLSLTKTVRRQEENTREIRRQPKADESEANQSPQSKLVRRQSFITAPKGHPLCRSRVNSPKVEVRDVLAVGDRIDCHLTV
jgi:hypothetical protein